MVTQTENFMVRDDERKLKKLLKTMRKYVAENMVERLVRMDMRSSDRDYHEGWMRYENFGHFYHEMHPHFVVGFSNPALLVHSVLGMYIRSQLSGLFDSLEKMDGVGYWTTRGFLDRSIDEHYDVFVAILLRKWPREYADILSRNAKFKPMMGMG